MKTCSRCTKEFTENDFGKSAYCKKCAAKYAREKRQRNRAKGLCACGASVRAEGKGACDHCNRERHTSPTAVERTRRHREKHKDRLAAERKARSQKTKREILAAYGGEKCACPNGCDMTFWEALTIDHINGGGNKHRKEVPNLYRWLKKNNFPPGFRVLCWTCNACLGKYGYCPHERNPKLSS